MDYSTFGLRQNITGKIYVGNAYLGIKFATDEKKNNWTLLNSDVNTRLMSVSVTLRLGLSLTRMLDIDLKFMHAVTYELNIRI